MPRAKADLRVYWSKKENALVYWGAPSEGGCLSYVFETLEVNGGKPLKQYLEEAGYDLKTLRFQIRKRAK